MMNATEKIKAMLEKKHVDFIGACGWMHTPDIDRKSPEEFAKRVIAMTDENNWDFIKLMSNGWYVPEAYGEDLEFYSENIPLEFQKIKRLADIRTPLIKTEDDLENLPVISKDNPVIQRNAEVVRILAEHYKGTIPIITTLFTPCTLIPDLSGSNERFHEFADECPEKLHKALKALLQTNMNIVDAFAEAGSDGFFIASKHSSPSMISEDDFDRYCAAYDKQLVAHCNEKAWFNMIHAHGQKDMYIKKYLEYDVQAINWENMPHGKSGPGIVSVAEMRSMTDKVLIGGTDQFYDFYGDVKHVRSNFAKRLAQLAKESGDNRFIFAPGCSLPLDVDPEVIHQLRLVVDDYNADPANFQ